MQLVTMAATTVFVIIGIIIIIGYGLNAR